MAKAKTVFLCGECGYETGKWLGRCPSCGSFNTLSEFTETPLKKERRQAGALPKITTLAAIERMDDKRTPTRIKELDRVLNGGIVEGSLVLLGGDPGIGKSTLILQVCQNIGAQGGKVLYISGEESVNQIKLRADRLGVTTENLMLLAETCLETIESAVNEAAPAIMVVDSIQTIYSGENQSVPGSVSQVRECTSRFMNISKTRDISTIIIGHVTKEGAIAGPRILEHMVDTVLYFEGEQRASYRIIRAVKNRFGSTNEIGVFEMQEKGLSEISNPSEYMLSGRPFDVSGSVVTCSIEGTRAILAEVQALISYTSFGMPRRTASGMDYNRVIMLMAVLEKRFGLQLGTYDSYVNIAGGMKIMEPALDAAVVSAIASSFRNAVIDPYTMVFGEVGLTGEIRAVSMAEKRVSEAIKLGFKRCVLPKANLKGLSVQKEQAALIGVSNAGELLDLLTGR